MGLLIATGLIFVAVKLSEKLQSGKTKITQTETRSVTEPLVVPLEKSENIKRVFACGANVCVFSQTDDETYRLHLIAAETGTIVQTILFSKK